MKFSMSIMLLTLLITPSLYGFCVYNATTGNIEVEVYRPHDPQLEFITRKTIKPDTNWCWGYGDIRKKYGKNLQDLYFKVSGTGGKYAGYLTWEGPRNICCGLSFYPHGNGMLYESYPFIDEKGTTQWRGLKRGAESGYKLRSDVKLRPQARKQYNTYLNQAAGG